VGEVMIRDDIIFEADGLNQCLDLTSRISCLGLVNPLPIHDLKSNIAKFFVSVKVHGEVSVLKYVYICWFHNQNCFFISKFKKTAHKNFSTKFGHPIKDVHFDIVDNR